MKKIEKKLEKECGMIDSMSAKKNISFEHIQHEIKKLEDNQRHIRPGYITQRDLIKRLLYYVNISTCKGKVLLLLEINPSGKQKVIG